MQPQDARETVIENRPATNWYFLVEWIAICNFLFYLTTKNVFGAFKVFLKIWMDWLAIAWLHPGSRQAKMSHIKFFYGTD